MSSSAALPKPRSPFAPWLLLCLACGAHGVAVSRSAQDPADLVVIDAVVHTLEPARPTAEAFAVRAGRIVAVGSASDALRLRGARTRVVDLHGRTVLPGLADAHVHPAMGEFLRNRLCSVRAFSVPEGFDRLRRCIATAPAGDWVVGFGWYDIDNPAFDRVTRAQLDALVADRKLAVLSWDLHTIWVNSRVLDAYGVTAATADPPGGRIARDERGEPTGELIDTASEAVYGDIAHRSAYARPTGELLRAAMAHLNSLGITSIVDAYADDDTAAAYHRLDLRGELTMRVDMAAPVTPQDYRERIAQVAAQRGAWLSPRVRLDYIKVFADGNLEVGLASMLNRAGPGTAATAGYYTQAQMNELVGLSEAAGLSVFVHAIGDGAARQALDAIAQQRRATDGQAFRHTLTHLCWIDPQDMPRLRALGVIANIQEGWLAPSAFGGPPGFDYARNMASGPVGPWVAGRMQPYRSIRDAGARLAAGSDWYYTEENPWTTIEAGMTSRDPGGASREAMLPQETLSLDDLLRAHTSGAAYQSFSEGEVGTLAPGKRADFIVVDRDPLETAVDQLHQVRVLETFIDGVSVYRAAGR